MILYVYVSYMHANVLHIKMKRPACEAWPDLRERFEARMLLATPLGIGRTKNLCHALVFQQWAWEGKERNLRNVWCVGVLYVYHVYVYIHIYLYIYSYIFIFSIFPFFRFLYFQ